jgi:CBS domain containing-hemolysin-like protein
MSSSTRRLVAPTPRPRAALLAGLLAALLAPAAAHASFLSGDTLATAANYLAVFVIIVVPIAVIVLFWLVHILPEKIAHKRHHPQKDAIQVLCLLSLVFGGMLWPIAWLWAYSRPVLYKMAYGTDKHEDYLKEHGGEAATRPVQDEVSALRADLDRLAARTDAPRELEAIRDRLAALEPRLVGPAGETR